MKKNLERRVGKRVKSWAFISNSCIPISITITQSKDTLHLHLLHLLSVFSLSQIRNPKSEMAPKFLLLLIFAIIFLFISPTRAHLPIDTSMKLMADALEWPTTISLIQNPTIADDDDFEEDQEQDPRRSLFWRRVHYYISYGALAANRIPCPPRSGRPYYTHNCYKARGPVNPYSRGCTAITRCRR